MRASGKRDENGDSKTELEASSGAGNKPAEQSNQPIEAPKQDYIHVRARRGQATDSHSLAERVYNLVLLCICGNPKSLVIMYLCLDRT